MCYLQVKMLINLVYFYKTKLDGEWGCPAGAALFYF